MTVENDEYAFTPEDAEDLFYTEWLENFDADGSQRERVFPWLNWNERLLWYGDTGEGKSLLAMLALVDIVEEIADDFRYYVDLENGPVRSRERRDAILETRDADTRSAVPDAICRFGSRFNFAALVNEPLMMERWTSLRGLVVIDSLTKALDQLDLDEDSNRDVTRFVRTFVDPLIAKPKTSVLVLDNVGHEGNRPRGAKAKMQLFDRLERVTGGKTCTPDRTGTLNLTCTRSCDGDIGRIIEVRAGGGVYDSMASAGELDPRLAEIVTILEGASEPLSGNQLEQGLRDAGISPGRKQTFQQSLKQWTGEYIAVDDDGRYVRKSDDD